MNKKAFTIIKCPKCKKEIKINIANAIDEDGELYDCSYCGYTFRYTER